MKRLTPLIYGLILLLTLSFGTSLPASAHTARPASPALHTVPAWDGNYNCYEDECDQSLPHQTRCPGVGLVWLGAADMYENNGRLDGTFSVYASKSGTTHCNTLWFTVNAKNTYITEFHIYNNRINSNGYTNEDNVTYQANYAWPYYPTGFNDGYQAGTDDNINFFIQDSFSGSVHWWAQNGTEFHATNLNGPYAI